ncbi:hypothetical protein B0A55_01475 [Friedmanniomyces simplex]|uniref:DNA repair protein RAD5 n=1 Tax=Friedmanniomyces simplex TaxID=329884 RepID=A0A4U0XXI9_9PEZI|nr:hypothetical protein B0A55_01475 [Friedmanniomyces simplex]
MSGFNFVSGWTPQFGINSRAPTPANPGMMQQFEPYGPKQSRKPAPAAPPPTVDDVRASFPRYDPNVLLGGAKAAINGGPVSNGAPSNDNSQSTTAEPGTGEALGFSHFMSNLHPTVNRDSVPQRKRKAETNDDDDTPAKQKSTFTGISKGGIISEHLRAEREKAAAEAGPSNIAIDLTADDDDGKGKDDDLMFMGEKQKKSVSEENKEVCLGGLQGKANISRIPMYSDRALAGLGKDTWPRLKLDHRRSENGQNNLKIELLDRAQRVVGLIEFRVAAALVPLLNGNNTNRLRMVVWLAQWPRAKNDRPGQHVSKHLDIQIILYAPRKHTAMIGKYLSQKQLFLTSLAGVYIGKELENPHVPVNFGGRGERKPQMSQPVHQVVRDPNELRREAQGMFDKMIRHEDLAEMEAEPSIIKTPLLAHQKQALQFMTDHEHNAPPKAGEAPAFSLWKPERSRHGHDVWVHVITGQEEANEPKPVYGGILADMMGLGKTLSILSLIAHTKKEAEAFGQKELPRSSEYLERNAKTTVIICPKSVMSNWQEQIKIHVKSNKLSYYNYHGSNRHQDLDELAKYDIILTTYGTAAEDLKAKGKALFQVNWFRIVLDEAHGIRNQNTGVSKACIALTAERRWAVTGTPVQNGLNDMGALVKFLRIYPFDHSHTWNTHIIIPLKSGNTDVIAHLRLLVDSITLRRLKDKIGLKDRKEVENHLEFSEADRKVYERIANQSSRDMMLMTGGKTAMKGKAYAHMLRLIDRMRRYCAHGLDMFNEEDRKQIAEGMNPDNAIAVDLGDEPDYEPYEFIGKQQAYETLHLINESDTDRCEKCGNKLSDKPLDAEGNADASGDEEDETSSDSESDDSGTTNTKADDVLSYLTPCFHVLCPGCKDTYIEQANESMTVDQRHECPSCNTFIRFGLFEFHRSGLQEYLDEKNAKTKKRNGRRIWDETNYNGPSAKVLALIHDLQLAAAESADLEALGEPPIRSVVFSQWTSYLDLIEVALEEHEIGFTRLDGTMSIGQRTRVMELFKTDPRVTVILVSIKAGGQGLNFTAASRVFMMEPQYNPGVEQQAIDRVHRLGQRRDVLITHYFITNTIEQKIQQLQRRKEDLARFTLERKLSKVEEAKKRIEGLRDLFR